MADRIQTLSPQFVSELSWTVDQVKRLVNGGLRGDEQRLSRASDGVIIVPPEDGIAARDGATMYGDYCYLYRIYDETYGDNEISLEAILDGNGNCLRQKVFNASTSAFSGTDYHVSELFRSGHRYVAPTTDERLKFWRTTYTSTNNTGSGDTDVYLWSTAESRYAVAATTNPDVTYSASPKTITFKVAGSYRVGVHLSVSVNSSSISPSVRIEAEAGVFRGGVFTTVAEYHAINIPELVLWSGYDSGTGSCSAFAETHLTVRADDILAVRFGRAGDSATSMDLYATVRMGRAWT